MRFNEWLVYRKDHFALFLAVILSLTIIFSNSSRQVQTMRAWALDGFGYLLRIASTFDNYHALNKKNEWLRHENTSLMLENSQLKEAMLENVRLRGLLDFKSKSQINLIPAKVMGYDENGFVSTIILYVGSKQGVAKNMAVVTSQGLIGKIYSVNEDYSIAQLLSDRNFRVSAMIQRSRVTGIVKAVSKNEFEMVDVPKRLDVTIDDKVITSGLSRIFPRGLEIGTIQSINNERQGMFMHITLKPAADFSKLEEVFVINMQQTQIN